MFAGGLQGSGFAPDKCRKACDKFKFFAMVDKDR
jgi:hypothetical protein